MARDQPLQYVNLGLTNVPPIELDGFSAKGLGEGTGLRGLPGDWTPPSRFTRAAVIAHGTLPPADTDAGMLAVLHVVNAFAIPIGLVRSDAGGDFTQWSSISDLAGRRYTLRTYSDPTPRMLALADLDLKSGNELRSLPLPSDPAFATLAI